MTKKDKQPTYYDKPFEGCHRVKNEKGEIKYTDADFHDISDEDDAFFTRILKELGLLKK